MASLAEACAGVLLPAACSLCGGALPLTGSAAGVCGTCWDAFPPSRPGCPTCGDPAADDLAPCWGCRLDPPPWRGMACLGPYENDWRAVVLQLKHHRRDELARPLGARLADTVRRSTWPTPDTLVPVPMWWPRRLWRGFNQAELLARRAGRQLGVPVRLLLSRRRGVRQVGRRRSQRLRLGTTEIRARRPAPPRVVLVDDVVTTGATARACCRALRAAGAREVYLLAVARTPRLWRSS